MVKKANNAHINSEFFIGSSRFAEEAEKREEKVQQQGDGASATLPACSLQTSSCAPVLCLLYCSPCNSAFPPRFAHRDPVNGR